MDLKANSPGEATREKQSAHSNERKVELRDSRELSEAKDAGKAAFIEAIGMDESVETTGKISEVLGEAQDQSGDGSGSLSSAQAAKFDPAQIKEQLLMSIPAEKEIRRQIEREIKREIKYLHKKAMRMFRSPGETSYYEMNNVVKKIRELRGILMRLAKLAADSLKSLWLRYVHGVMN